MTKDSKEKNKHRGSDFSAYQMKCNIQMRLQKELSKRGKVTEVSGDTGISRVSIYDAWKENPTLNNLTQICQSLGLYLVILDLKPGAKR